MTSVWSLALRLWAAVPCLMAYPLARLGTRLQWQLTPPRIWAIYLLLSGLALLAGLLTSLVLHRLGLVPAPSHGRARRIQRACVYGTVLLNVLALGWLIIPSAAYAAGPAYPVWAGGLGLVLLGLYVRQEDVYQRWIIKTLLLMGAGFAALPVLALPYITAHAWHDSPPVVAFPELPAARADAPARIVLVTFDAWRYRSTAFASPERVAQTPHLAALGDESTVFDACRSPGDQTLVSLASLLTGVYPPQIFSTPHNRWYSVREGSLPHLGSLLKGAGYGSTYHTAWVNPTYFGRGSDFDDGRTDPWRPQVQFNTEAFLPWRALLAWAPHVISQRVNPWTLSSDAIYVTQLYVDSLTAPPRTASPRRFQWLHLPTPHVPYMKVPPALLGKRLNAAERQSISAHEVVPGGGPAELEAAYEGYVRFADAELGRLVQQLKDAGAWDDTMLVVTADHGEAHEGAPRLYHGFGEPVRDVVHVPLVIHFPGQRSGSRVRAPVSGIDLVPTLLDAVYGEVPTYLKGRSLMKGAHPPRRMVFSWCMPDPNQSAPQAAAIGGFDGRYEFVSPVLPAGPPRLYDTLGQPGLDVSAQQPELLRRFQAQMLNDCPPRWPSP